MAGQVWSTNSLGGFMYSDQLSDILRTALQPMVRFRQFADIKEAKGLSTGEEYHWNIYSDVASGADATGIAESATLPETNFTITQGSLTVTEFGNSVPYTKKLDDFSYHPVKEIIHKVLKNDARKTLDTAAYNQFATTPLVMYPTGGTSTTAVTLETDGVPDVTNNAAMTKEHVKAISDIMKERDIPPYDGDNYISIARPTTYRTFKNDLELIHQYIDAGFQLIMNGEVGRYEGIRFIEQTNVASKNWANSQSDEAFFFGADTVVEAIVIPEEIRGKIPTDFGRSRGVAWYYVGGFGIVHTDAVQSRILKWDSAT